jgi:predicted transcriptional regulator of viral defense system
MDAKPDYDRLYEYAEEQAGYFTVAQAHQAGFSWKRISNSIRSGKFLRIAAGVYRLTQFPCHPHEDLFSAWLSTGPHSAISHVSALAYYDLSDVLPVEIHVIFPRTASRRRKKHLPAHPPACAG